MQDASQEEQKTTPLTVETASPSLNTSAKPKTSTKPSSAASTPIVLHHGRITAITGSTRQRDMEGTAQTTVLRGTLLTCLRMACAPFPGHSAFGIVFCHIFYLIALLARCVVGAPEPGASVEIDVPTISALSPGQYVGMFLSFAQAFLIGGFCSQDAFEENPWGGLGQFLAFLGLLWIITRNAPTVTTDVADLGATNSASTMFLTVTLELLTCIGLDLLIFSADAKSVFGDPANASLPTVVLIAVGLLAAICAFILYANQGGSTFSVDVSNNEEASGFWQRVCRNLAGLVFLAGIIVLGLIGLAAPFSQFTIDGTSLTTKVVNPSETAQTLGVVVVIIVSDILLVLMQACLLPKCRWGACGSGNGAVVRVEAATP